MKILDHKYEREYCHDIFISDEFVTTIPPVFKTIIETNYYDPDYGTIVVDAEQAF